MPNVDEEVVQIDEHNLDRECLRLPGDYLKWSHASADSRRDVDEAKAALELVEAELAKKIRQEPNVYGLEKVTEGALREVLVTRKDYKEARQAFADAKHQYDLNQAVVSALEMKKRTLTLLVELHGMSYFSEVKMSDKGRQAMEAKTERAVLKKRHRDRDLDND